MAKNGQVVLVQCASAMAAPIVVVQGLPPAPDLHAAVLSACSDALKHRSCVSGDDREPGAATAAAVAVIAWPDGSDRHVRVTLERFDVAPVRRTNRDTRFADEDPIVERWRTIGLVIAALVGESEAASAGIEESESQSGRSSGPTPRASGWLGLSALGGPGLDDGSVRLGAAVDGAFGLRSSPVFLSASLGYAVRPTDDRKLGVRWTTLAVGAGARAVLPSIDLGLRVRFELMLEHLLATAASGSTVSGGGSRVSPGIRSGADILWPAGSAFGATLGFSVWSLPGGTSIQLDQRRVGSSQWLSYAAFLGAQWSFR